MYASTVWLNDYLDPKASAEEQAELLTRAGFPLEGSEHLAELDDVRQDFEMTSNRGDCTCHVGMAREIAALSGRTLRPPKTDVAATGGPASDIVRVQVDDTEACPRYTARVIRGVTIGPSPDWLANRLRGRGDIPRNNVVDATNFVLFELGQPTHVFDLDTLREKRLIVRRATADEPFLPLGEGAREVRLLPDDLVIADAERAVALAGVKGGALTAVTNTTTDVLVEAATFAPTTVRATSRRHNIASDSSYRFERGVHAGLIDAASDRLCGLILELCGGELCEGIVEDGAPIPDACTVRMRPDRCRMLLGIDIETSWMMTALDLLGFRPNLEGDVIATTVPLHRLDIAREVDVIEEIARMYGMDRIPVADTIQIRVAPPQPRELAKRAVNDALVGMGFVESITHSLIGEFAASAFLPDGASGLRVDDERARAEPVLRPSVVPSLLRVRKHNEDNGVESLRLFESASTFVTCGETHDEQIRLGMVADLHDRADGLRPMRGVLDRLVTILRGPDATLDLEPTSLPWLEAGATIRLDGETIGWTGLLDVSVQATFDLSTPVVVTDLDVHRYYDAFPPETEARALPSFPAIDRDVSAILADDVEWQALETAIRDLDPRHLEEVEFVTVFRGRQIPKGRKSLTLRLRFRAADRTLTHDDVDIVMNAVMSRLRERFDADIRS